MFDSLGDRMKSYEAPWRALLPPRMPVVVRVDGRAFHSFTRGLEKPFCRKLCEAMDTVAIALCCEIPNARLAYVQSDEISVLVTPYLTFGTQAWFGGQIQKTTSVAAGIASAVMTIESKKLFSEHRPAVFDARCFVLPESEVTNYFLWRQNDATRNSIQMLARSLYSHVECENKGQAALHDMCVAAGRNWNNLSAYHKRGRCIIRNLDGWTVDADIPIFKADGRSYVEICLPSEQPVDAVDAGAHARGA